MHSIGPLISEDDDGDDDDNEGDNDGDDDGDDMMMVIKTDNPRTLGKILIFFLISQH